MTPVAYPSNAPRGPGPSAVRRPGLPILLLLVAGLLALAGLAGCRSAPAPAPAPTALPEAAAPPAPGPDGAAAPPGGGETEPEAEATRPGATLPPLPRESPAEPLEEQIRERPQPVLPARGDSLDDLPVRIGLVSDLSAFEMACCGPRVHLTIDGSPRALEAPFRIEPASEAVGATTFRVQAAALRDEAQARALAGSLGAKSGWPADVRFDAGSGLYRVRVGHFPDRPRADAGRRRLAALGAGGAWVVQEGGGLVRPALRVIQGGRSFRVEGRWVGIEAADGAPLTLQVEGSTGRYRGAFLLYLNDRGTLNLVNELPLESYLRGVVPKEMGPELYPRLEALKAQAVAARTYMLRHLGEFLSEGYDLCAGPRCQVYGGMGVEHPRSDRAIEETAGQVLLWDGEPLDALYSATCGDHTEHAEAVFPWMAAPYLRGVPCPEGHHHRLATALPLGASPTALVERLLPAGLQGSQGSQGAEGPEEAADAFGRRLLSLAQLARLPLPADAPRSLGRGEVARAVRSLFDLALPPEVLQASTSTATSDGDVLDRLVSGLPAALVPGSFAPDPVAAGGRAPRDRELGAEEAGAVLLALAHRLGLLELRRARFLDLEAGQLTVREEEDGEGAEGVHRWGVPVGGLAGFVPRGGAGGGAVSGDLLLAPGDRILLLSWRGSPVGIAQEVDPHRLPTERGSRLYRWTRFRSDRQLAALVEERYPGLGYRGFEVLERGVSGRVSRLRLLGTGGQAEIVEGLAVRWTLDIPDTRFEARRSTGSGGAPGWTFEGGGWGHGVGLCQVGAFAMAGRGLDYREILSHYYTGARLGRTVLR